MWLGLFSCHFQVWVIQSLNINLTFVPPQVMVSTLKGKCVSDKEQLNLNTIYSNRGLGKYDVKYAKSSLKEEEMAGVVSMEGSFAGVTSNSISAGIMALIIVCSLSIFILLVVIGIYKYRQ